MTKNHSEPIWDPGPNYRYGAVTGLDWITSADLAWYALGPSQKIHPRVVAAQTAFGVELLLKAAVFATLRERASGHVLSDLWNKIPMAKQAHLESTEHNRVCQCTFASPGPKWSTTIEHHKDVFDSSRYDFEMRIPGPRGKKTQERHKKALETYKPSVQIGELRYIGHRLAEQMQVVCKNINES